ncbi:MAG: dihydrolipoyl dehydrogenase [Nitrospiraceae bacterium]|nr:dihydrolipoyl dehydrogenase [Nitrospiraceae bacterium]
MRLTIVGAGPGGYVAALKAAQLGAEVTVVEAGEVGGVCLNWGCIPTKTLIASAELLLKLKEVESFGIELGGQPVPNIEKIMQRKNKVVETQVKGIRGLFKSWGVRLVEGRGRLLDAKKVQVDMPGGSTQVIETDKVIIGTGSRPAAIPTFPFDGDRILSSDNALTIKAIPRSMIIVGAGVIGSEFGGIFNALGTEVTIVEMMDRAVSTEDLEISEVLEREYKKRKIKILKNIKVDRVETRPDGVHAFTSDGKELAAEKMLVSIGRTLNTERIGLEEAGVEKGKRGEILVDEHMETGIKGVYAIGDCTGRILLAHVASTQGIVAAKNACGIEEKMDYNTVPAAIFTSPEIASVGLREFQAKEKGLDCRIGRFHYRALGKAHAIGEIAGFVKVLADASTDKIIGAHIIGAHASDLIQEMAVAIRNGLTARQVAGTIHAHPTLAEGVMEACEAVHGEAIHMPKEKEKNS